MVGGAEMWKTRATGVESQSLEGASPEAETGRETACQPHMPTSLGTPRNLMCSFWHHRMTVKNPKARLTRAAATQVVLSTHPQAILGSSRFNRLRDEGDGHFQSRCCGGHSSLLAAPGR